jgi:hypothetical protein
MNLATQVPNSNCFILEDELRAGFLSGLTKRHGSAFLVSFSGQCVGQFSGGTTYWELSSCRQMQTRHLTLIAFSLLMWLGENVSLCQAQQLRIEAMLPRQLPRGRSTVVSVVVPSRDAIRAAEIAPSAGLKISDIKQGSSFQGALTWSEISIDVADDAEPGDRTLVLVLPMGRTAPVTITIPNHVPDISGLRVLPQPSNQSLELQFAAADSSADLGGSPYVWFMFHCGSELHPGVVRGTVSGQEKNNVVVNASVPRPSARGACDLQARVSDSGGIESNTLKATVDLKN